MIRGRSGGRKSPPRTAAATPAGRRGPGEYHISSTLAQRDGACMMIESQKPAGAVAIRPCRAEECEAVLALWRRAGAIPSATDTLEELLRLVRSEHGNGFLVAIQEGAIVGSVIGGWDGGRGNIYRLAVAPEARRRGPARRLVPQARARLWGTDATR